MTFHRQTWPKQDPVMSQDQFLQDQLTMNIQTDPALPHDDQEQIRVDVDHGVAWLSGVTHHPLSQRLACQDALHIPGLLGVFDIMELAD